MLKQEVVVPHFSQRRPVGIVDYGKMVGGRLGGGWLGVRVIVCATDSCVRLSARISLSARIDVSATISLSAGSQIRLFSQISLFLT